MKRTLTQLMFLLVFVLGASSTYAQRTVSGKVTDGKTGDPLIGANILVKGTSNGTITDLDGMYSLSVAEGSTLVFSYTGYANQEVVVGTSGNIDIALAEGSVLDEVVIVGYGSQKKRDVTGSVASLKEKDFNQGIVTSADQLLQNRVAGVNIINNSGQPGGQATVKIRGNNSIRAGANPLYVIDGVPLDGRTAKAGLLATDIGAIANSNPLNFLNPSDIANIDVLKDASSAAIYGSRASNGVILITTKKAKAGAPKVDFGVSLGTSSVLKKYDVLTADEYRGALTKYGLTSGDGKGNVDAFDQITRSGITQNYNVSIGGGSETATYRFSGGYQNIEGIIKDSGLKRYTASFNSNFKMLDGKIGIDALLIASQTIEDIAPISTNAGFTGNLIAQALQWNPTIPLTTANGDFTTAKNNPLVGETTINPLNLLDGQYELAKTTTTLANISPYWNITDNLVYRYRLGINYGVGNTRGNISGNVNVQGITDLGWAGFANNELLSTIHSHTLTYNKPISDDLAFDFVGGYEYQKFDFSGYALAGRGFAVPDNDNTNAIQNSSNANKRFISYADPISELQSYFGRANFGYKGKYNLTATLRADGSSKFGENNQYGIFPSIGASWNIKSEDFLADNDNISDMKLRLGWGKTGNQEFPAGSAQERYALTENGGSILENVANPDLKWESSTTLNFGLDFGIMNNRITGSIDYYNRVTNDLLLDPSVSEPGPAVRAWKNIDGEVANTGVEIGLNAQIINKENLVWTLGGNISFLNNEFRNYTGPPILTGDLFGQGSSGAYVQEMKNGYPLNTFFVREYLGLDETGNSKYTDGGDTFVAGGDPNANVIVGISTGLDLGKLSFNMNWNGAYGHQLFNNTAMSVLPIGNLGSRNIDASLLEGDIKESIANPITSSSRYIEDGDFIKLANATLSYNLGKVSKLSNVRLSLTGQNLLIITDYSGFDPEVNTVNLRNGVPSSGIEYIPYPSAKSFIFGLNVSF
ncbi:MAG TPA: SusC/RagA family TonB-linked outer membrane protein [Saprospiraceae bacterium]|nr:SusC/RagA family TonB-linked outer membrane protein [Saprospiraceae bacterium]